MVAHNATHADVTCPCGEHVSGHGIAAGYYDAGDLPLSPLSTGILGCLVVGAMVGGVCAIWAKGTTPWVVGICVAIFYFILFSSGLMKVKPPWKEPK